MHWRKLGLIFDPRDYAVLGARREFAQSPQPLAISDGMRFYFSTRTVDPKNGKYLSHVAFVDFDETLTRVIRVSEREVLPLGKLGCFDEHGIFPINALRVGDLIYGYTCGWSRRVSVSVETAIGLVKSRDGGETFSRVGDGPVLGPSIAEPFLVGDGHVQQIGGVFHMWYIFGTAWRRSSPDQQAERTYKIGHAMSTDGVEWRREEGRQIIADRIGSDECQALPSVIWIHDRFRMFLCYRQSFDFRTNAARGYRIGHASSTDLRDWVRDDHELPLEISLNAWDSEMLCYPTAFSHCGRTYLAYNGDAFGRYGFGLAVLES